MSLIHRPTLHECALMSPVGQAGILGGAGAVSAGGAAFPAGMVHTWDAATGYTIATGVSLWEDQVGSVDLAQATTTKQPTRQASNSNLNSQPSIDGDGSDDVLAASTGKALATIKKLHTGPCTLYVGCYLVVPGSVVNDTLFSTQALSASEVGIWVGALGTNEYRVLLGNGASAHLDVRVSPKSTAKVALVWTMDASGNYDFRINDSSIASGSTTVDTGDATRNPQVLAGTTAGTDAGAHEVGLIHIWDSQVSTSEIQAAHEARFGT